MQIPTEERVLPDFPARRRQNGDDEGGRVKRAIAPRRAARTGVWPTPRQAVRLLSAPFRERFPRWCEKKLAQNLCICGPAPERSTASATAA